MSAPSIGLGDVWAGADGAATLKAPLGGELLVPLVRGKLGCMADVRGDDFFVGRYVAKSNDMHGEGRVVGTGKGTKTYCEIKHFKGQNCLTEVLYRGSWKLTLEDNRGSFSIRSIVS